jgi:hypothetical protein
MTDELTDRDKSILMQAMVISAAHWATYPAPDELVSVANSVPLSLYITLKYLQSLPEGDTEREGEREMKAMLLANHPDFVERAIALDHSPPDLADEGSKH